MNTKNNRNKRINICRRSKTFDSWGAETEISNKILNGWSREKKQQKWTPDNCSHVTTNKQTFTGVYAVCGTLSDYDVCVCLQYAYRFFISRMTPRKMMMKSRMPAMDPAIFTVWSDCFSCSGSGFLVAAPETINQD